MTREELEQRLARTEATVHALQKELEETNRGLVALTLELEQRVDARTAELRQVNQQLEERVEQRTSQLREANDNLQNFAHTAAHDLRAPLRAIRNFATLVAEEHATQLDGEGLGLLQRVTGAAAQMQQLLDDLLEYSKLGQAELKLEKVSLQAAVRDALSLLSADIQSKKAALRIEEPLPEVVGHSATVVLLINNYISNALKFIVDGVQPQIRIWAQEVHRAEKSEPGREASFARLWVEDNGIGIDPKYMDKVFQVFQRLHGKNAYPGTGLGLAIVRKGAERMGGAVGVESQPGHGSRFWVELRRA